MHFILKLQKSLYPAFNLAHAVHGTETKKLKQKPSNSQETVQAVVYEGSLGGGFVKEVGFQPEVNERESWMCRVVKQKRKN